MSTHCPACHRPFGEGGCNKVTTTLCTIEKLREEIDQLRVQLAGCSVAASGWNSNILPNPSNPSAKPGDFGWSVAYQDVTNLRQAYENLKNSIEIG